MKFDELKESWKAVAVDTIKSIRKTLDDSEPSSSDPANSLATETTKLVIGGRTFCSNQSDSKPHGLDKISQFQFRHRISQKNVFLVLKLNKFTTKRLFLFLIMQARLPILKTTFLKRILILLFKGYNNLNQVNNFFSL